MIAKHNVLFLCTGNSARSQIGEALLRKYGSDQFEVYSAGLVPKGMNPYTIRVMDEIGLDVRNQWSKGIKEYMGKMFFRYVITVCSDADKNCPVPLWARGGTKLHWPFDDPAAIEGTDEEKLAKFRQVRDQMDTKIKTWLEELAAEKANT
jgi:arsenate reductase